MIAPTAHTPPGLPARLGRISMPILYRVVKRNPPIEEDFFSPARLGRPLHRDTPALRRSWEGVSAADTESAARGLARRFPMMGAYIAVLDVPEDGSIQFEQTGADAHHFDLWAEPHELLARVVATVSV